MFGRGAHQCRTCQHEERPALVAAADLVIVRAPVPAPNPAPVQAPMPAPVPAPPAEPAVNQDEDQEDDPYIQELSLGNMFTQLFCINIKLDAQTRLLTIERDHL